MDSLPHGLLLIRISKGLHNINTVVTCRRAGHLHATPRLCTTFSLAPQCGKLHITGSLCVYIPLYNYVSFNFSFNIPVVCVSIKALLT